MAKQTSADLHKLIVQVLKALDEIRYEVLFISADNSRINRRS